MSTVDQATATQLANIQVRTGRTLEQLAEILRASGLTRHGELRDLLKRDLGMGHGDANTLVHHVMKSDGAAAAAGLATADVVAEIYSGPKAGLQPIHDRLMEEIERFGAFEVAPKKGYVSLRRKKQFAMIGPATNTRVEVGVNAKGLAAGERLTAMPPKSMCDFKVRLADAAEVDAELVGWIRTAFDAAG